MFNSLLGRFLGEGDGTPPVVPPTPPTPPATPPVGTVFTQEQVNTMLAENKRNLQKKIEELSKNSGTTEQLNLKIKELNNTLLTKEELAKQEADNLKIDYENKLKTETETRTAWENRYKDQAFEVALGKAATKHDAFDPDQLAMILKSDSTVMEITDKAGAGTGKFKVETKVTIDGKELTLPIDEAIGKLRESGKYPNQFKVKGSPGTGTTLNNSPGSSANDSDTPPTDTAKYMEWYKARQAKGLIK